MTRIIVILILSIALLTSACNTKDRFPIVIVSHIETPTVSSGQSRLVVDSKGSAYLSWIEYNDSDTFQLQYAQLRDDDTWSSPEIIAKGDDWFINWADFPALSIFEDGSKAAHWLRMRDIGTYDYDVHISTQGDDQDWQPSFIPHRDSIAAEHGFVSMVSTKGNQMLISWLDGRNTKAVTDDSNDDHGHGHHGSMTLRTATFDTNGNLSQEHELDQRICDCCQTDIAMTGQGPIIVYRDRSKEEVRDISIVRRVDDKWTDPQPVYNDEWQINGCPVNGPAVAANGSHVIVAWYTGANDTSHVKAALSNDNGANFDLPVLIDDGMPLGRVDVTWVNDESAVITWLEKTGDTATIKLKWIRADGTVSPSQAIIKTSASRQSGFPIIVKDKSSLLITWTEVTDNKTVVRSARLDVQ